MSEATARSYLVKKMVSLDAVAIESPSTGLGIPDVFFIGGVIECKWLRDWPKGCDKNPVKFPHPLTQEQKVWLYRRSLRGGLAMVAAKVSRSWFFFDGKRMKDKWETMTRPEMIEEAILYFQNGLDIKALLSHIKACNDGGKY